MAALAAGFMPNHRLPHWQGEADVLREQLDRDREQRLQEIEDERRENYTPDGHGE